MTTGASSKKKGAVNEVMIAEQLSAWWGKPFKRMPASGALRWKGAAFTYGDLLPPEDFPCIVECKHYKFVDLDEIIGKDPKKGYVTWWWYDQVWADVARCHVETGRKLWPMLVFRSNQKKPRVVLDSLHSHDLFADRSIKEPAMLYGRLPDLRQFTMYDLASFLAAVPATRFRDVGTM